MFVKLIRSLVLGVALAAALPAVSHAYTLDFEGVGSFGSISEFYNGGFDIPSTGAPATGVNYGASFTGDALALQNDSLGPYFANAPTPGTIMFVAPGSDAVLNVASGFKDSISFYYSSAVDAFNVVKIYSGLNHTGTLLAKIALQINIDNGCTGATFCNFQQISHSFAGIGKSIDFGASPAVAGQVAFDNVSITPVPEPESLAMLLAGLGLMGAVVRRRKQA